MNKATKALLLKKISENGRLLNTEEAIDFYVEHIMRKSGTTCPTRFSHYKNYDENRKVFRGGYVDLSFEEISQRASWWHRSAIGSLVLSGDLIAFSPNNRLQ